MFKPLFIAVLFSLSNYPLAIAQENTTSSVEKFVGAASRTTTPLNPVALDKAILESADQIPFNSNEWKNSVGQRQHMLVDFYKLHLLSKTPDQIHGLIGEPFPFKDTVDHHMSFMPNNTINEFYDLGTFEDRSIFLNIFFVDNHVYALRIGQMLLPDSLNVFTTEWHWTNPNNFDVAKDLNKHFHIVGAPTKHLCQFTGHPKHDGAYWTSGDIQLQYALDQNTVKRFRVVSTTRGTVHHTTKWETKNSRINKGSYSTARDFLELSNQQDEYFIKPYNTFSRTQWDEYKWRRFMLFDLTHNYKIIGKTRTDIRNILGEPAITEDTETSGKLRKYFDERIRASAQTNKFDWYPLNGPQFSSIDKGKNAATEVSESLELVYTNGKVAGYRIIDGDLRYQEHSKSQLGGTVSAIMGGPVSPLTE